MTSNLRDQEQGRLMLCKLGDGVRWTRECSVALLCELGCVASRVLARGLLAVPIKSI